MYGNPSGKVDGNICAEGFSGSPHRRQARLPSWPVVQHNFPDRRTRGNTERGDVSGGVQLDVRVKDAVRVRLLLDRVDATRRPRDLCCQETVVADVCTHIDTCIPGPQESWKDRSDVWLPFTGSRQHTADGIRSVQAKPESAMDPNLELSGHASDERSREVSASSGTSRLKIENTRAARRGWKSRRAPSRAGQKTVLRGENDPSPRSVPTRAHHATATGYRPVFEGVRFVDVDFVLGLMSERQRASSVTARGRSLLGTTLTAGVPLRGPVRPGGPAPIEANRTTGVDTTARPSPRPPPP